MHEIIKLLIFSTIAVFYLFFISKFLGKKQIAQLEFIDYVMGISIGSIASEMASDTTDRPFYYYLISMTVFFLIDIFITFLGRKGPFFKNFLKGKPIVIIYNGEILYKNLKKSKLDVNDIMGMSREQGYFYLSEIKYAIFENSGKLSIMPNEEQKVVTVDDLKLKAKKTSLPYYLIVDGRISKSTLNELKKNKTWLMKEAKLTKKSIKNVLLASYDPETQKIELQTKS